MGTDYVVELPFSESVPGRFAQAMTLLAEFPDVFSDILDDFEAAPGNITGAQRAHLSELRDTIHDLSELLTILQLGGVSIHLLFNGEVTRNV